MMQEIAAMTDSQVIAYRNYCKAELAKPPPLTKAQQLKKQKEEEAVRAEVAKQKEEQREDETRERYEREWKNNVPAVGIMLSRKPSSRSMSL